MGRNFERDLQLMDEETNVTVMDFASFGERYFVRVRSTSANHIRVVHHVDQE